MALHNLGNENMTTSCKRVFEVALHNQRDEDTTTSLQASVWSGITQRGRWGHGNKPAGECLNWHYTTREMRTWQWACRRVFEVALHSEGDEDMATSLQVSVWIGITQRGNEDTATSLQVSVWIGITQRGRWGHDNKPAGQCVTCHYITKDMRTWQQACRSVFEVALHN